MVRKAELRARMRALAERRSVEDIAERSEAIHDRVLATPEVEAATNIFAYVSLGAEVETTRLILRLISDGKSVLIPLVVGPGFMEAHRIRSLETLRPGKFGILEPTVPDCFDGTPDVALCPGVAFSPRGERLGRGKGYYDRYLTAHPGAFAIGLAFDSQVVDDLPVSPGDVPVALVLTESRELRR